MSVSIVECHFFLPLKRDAILSDGQPHSTEDWERLEDELEERFQGMTIAPGTYQGFYRDPDTGEMVNDESFNYILAIPETELDKIRELLRDCCEWFQQKCMYLAIAGRVEFITRRGEQ